MHIHIHHRGPDDSSKALSPSLPAAGETSSELRFLQGATVHLRHADGRLQMRQQGEDAWQEVCLVRLFPLSEPEEWISVLDEKGKELGILQDLKGMSAEDLACVRQELSRRYLVPQIRRIRACRDKFDLVEWTVETDRGKVTFTTRNLRDQVKQPLPRRLTITDVEGNRYDVPDLAALDLASRRMLETRL